MSRPKTEVLIPGLISLLVFWLRVPCPVEALPQQSLRRETLAVRAIPEVQGAECTHHLWSVLLRSQHFNVWPAWYLQQQLSTATFPAELDNLVEGHLLIQADQARLSVVMTHQQAGERELTFADSRSAPVHELESLCQEMGYRILGQAPTPTPDSPALAASLSLVIPGAGHFYQGKTVDVLLGSLFLGGFLVLTYLGFSPQEEGGLTRQQWGGVLMLLSLSDVLSAYFLSLPPRGGT